MLTQSLILALALLLALAAVLRARPSAVPKPVRCSTVPESTAAESAPREICHEKFAVPQACVSGPSRDLEIRHTKSNHRENAVALPRENFFMSS
tara:strand:- start:125 stop:406 length:282 start_codon:yes stop_codon:yes gene_type:complete